MRQLLLVQAKHFQRPALLTLTIDRSEFASPEAAHAYVSANGRIRLLLRRLGLVRWVWVLEFQKKTGDGWPHWHILVDLADAPGGRIDLKRAWEFWREKWGIGGLDLQQRRGFDDPKHAVMYITKYLQKQPHQGYPLWVLESEKRIRLFQGSRLIGPLVNPHCTPRLPQDGESKPKRAQRRKLVGRMAECGQRSVVLVETDCGDGGSVIFKHVGAAEIRPDRLAALKSMGRIDGGVQVETVAFGDECESSAIRPFIPIRDPAYGLEQLDKLREVISTARELDRTWEEIQRREAALKERANNYGKLAWEAES
jgi:hypothetical protein